MENRQCRPGCPNIAAIVAAVLGGFLGRPDVAEAAWEPGWTVAPYGWLAGFDGSIGSTTDSIDPGDTFQLPRRIDVTTDGKLRKVGFMFYGEWRGDRWLALLDSVWANVSQAAELSFRPILPDSQATAAIDGNIYLLAAGYRLTDWQMSFVEIYAGARYYDIEATIELQGGLLPAPVSTQESERWTDAVLGARWRHDINDRWRVAASTDVGIGRFDASWNIAASLSYRLSWGSIVAGYRYLALDAETDDFRADLALMGPMIGLAFRF